MEGHGERSCSGYFAAGDSFVLTGPKSLGNLAEIYRTQGQYAKAEPLYQRALAIQEQVLGPEHSTFHRV